MILINKINRYITAGLNSSLIICIVNHNRHNVPIYPKWNSLHAHCQPNRCTHFLLPSAYVYECHSESNGLVMHAVPVISPPLSLCIGMPPRV